jgi:geranylgeranyl pyrophosphate synthase
LGEVVVTNSIVNAGRKIMGAESKIVQSTTSGKKYIIYSEYQILEKQLKKSEREYNSLEETKKEMEKMAKEAMATLRELRAMSAANDTEGIRDLLKGP